MREATDVIEGRKIRCVLQKVRKYEIARKKDNMSVGLFEYLASHTGSLWRGAKDLYHQFELEVVPEEALTSLQDVINELGKLRQHVVHKYKFEDEIVDYVSDYPDSKAEWIRLLNKLYESANVLIHQFSITDNDTISRTMSLLKEQQTGRLVREAFTIDWLIGHMIAAIERGWSYPGEGAKSRVRRRNARRYLDNLLKYITHLQETSQEEEANQLIERLRALDLDIDLSSIS